MLQSTCSKSLDKIRHDFSIRKKYKFCDVMENLRTIFLVHCYVPNDWMIGTVFTKEKQNIEHISILACIGKILFKRCFHDYKTVWSVHEVIDGENNCAGMESKKQDSE